jgi:hypothetical protein
MVEASVWRADGAYDNSVAEVVGFMVKAGYNLMDITDLNRSPKHGVLWLCELAFCATEVRSWTPQHPTRYRTGAYFGLALVASY